MATNNEHVRTTVLATIDAITKFRSATQVLIFFMTPPFSAIIAPCLTSRAVLDYLFRLITLSSGARISARMEQRATVMPNQSARRFGGKVLNWQKFCESQRICV
jgi:hypothetical protein